MIYEFTCKKCGTINIEHPMAEDHPTTCPTCNSPIQRIFAVPGMAFKGDGFFSTDSILQDPDPDDVLDAKLDRRRKGQDVD